MSHHISLGARGRIGALGLALAGALALLGAAPAQAAAPFTQIYAFGDSLSDNGNLYALSGGRVPPAGAYWNGRFSNGPTAVEDLAAHFNVGLTDFAYGGARVGLDNSLSSSFYGTGVSGQVGRFAQAAGGHADSGALYFVWAGANDFLDPALAADPNRPAYAAGTLMADITTLYNSGARDFLVPTLPDLGGTPRGTGGGSAYQQLLHQDSLAFNSLLTSSLAAFGAAHADAKFTVFDTAAFYATEVPLLASQGVNVTDACMNSATGTVCADPSKYLSWDGLHPTAMGHQLMANAMAAAVPEPATSALLLAGLGVLGLRARRQHRRAAAAA